MFVVLLVEECYAEVIEVEADNRWDVLKPLTMAMQVVQQEHRLAAKMLQCLVGGFLQQAHVNLSVSKLALYVGMLASAQQIAFLQPCITGEDYRLWLKVVGQSQEQMQTSAPTEAMA